MSIWSALTVAVQSVNNNKL